MNFQKVVMVVDRPGLYEFKSHNKNGFFLESMEDQQQVFIANAKKKVLALGNIDIACENGSIALLEIFKRMNSSDLLVPDPKDDAEVMMTYFQQIVPDFDRKQVYPSTVRKVITWFLFLDQKLRSFHEVTNEEDKSIGFS